MKFRLTEYGKQAVLFFNDEERLPLNDTFEGMYGTDDDVVITTVTGEEIEMPNSMVEEVE